MTKANRSNSLGQSVHEWVKREQGMKTRFIFAIACLAFILIVLGTLYCKWSSNESIVTGLMSNPDKVISQEEGRFFYRYVEGDLWHSFPTSSISPSRQEMLVKAAIRRTADTGCEDMLMPIAEMWHKKGLFPTFPDAVNEALRVRMAHVNIMLALLLTHGSERGFSDHLVNVDEILESGDDVAYSACFCLAANTLYDHKAACIKMLEGPDYAKSKCILLMRLAEEEDVIKWFESEPGFLDTIGTSGDTEMDKQIRMLAEKISIRGQWGHSTFPGPRPLPGE
jgi:hypothetical protein